MTCLNPQQMKQFLETQDGVVVKAKVKIEKASGRYEASNRSGLFHTARIHSRSENNHMEPARVYGGLTVILTTTFAESGPETVC